MNHQQLISKLEQYLRNPSKPSRGDVELAQYLLHFFVNRPAEKDDKSSILNNLCIYVVEAFDQLRQGQDAQTAAYRKAYLQAVNAYEVPYLTEVSFSDFERLATINQVSRLMTEITSDSWVGQDIESYLMAQDKVIHQKIRAFINQVYFHGLQARIDASSWRGMSGSFGNTELRSLVAAGRIMVTFARKTDDGDEDSVTLIGREGGPYLNLQSTYASFSLALDMIDEVISNWPTDREQQAQIYHDNTNVGIGIGPN